MKRLIPMTIIALALCACQKSEPKQQEETISVKTEKAALGELTSATPYVGVVEEEQSTLVSFTGMATLKTLHAREGQTVRKGQLLATIDDTQARNALAAAKSALDQATDAHARMKTLHESNSLPEMKWVEIESKLQQAKASYDMCLKNVEDCSLYAPCNGVVGSKIMNVGETVLPSQPVLHILSIDRVKVRVSIPEKEIATITPETATLIMPDALPGESFEGGKIEKGVSADAVSHTYDIRIALENPGHKLLPGMVAKVAMKDNAEERKITLPVKAVQQTTDKTLFVWVEKDGKAQRRPITVGETSGNRIVIESGLQEGDNVIVEGYQKVGEGTPIKF